MGASAGRIEGARCRLAGTVGLWVHTVGAFDTDNPCDLCGKPLLVTSPVRGRCDQCALYGPPVNIALPIREFSAKAESTSVACAGCGRDRCHDGVTALPLVERHCLSCRLDGLHKAAG